MNDSSVTLAAMAAVAGRLLSFAGQHEYRRLLDPGYQLAVLDQWAGPETLRLAGEYRTTFERAAGCARALEESRQARQGRLREIDLLRFQIGELAAAGLSARRRGSAAGRAAGPLPGRRDPTRSEPRGRGAQGRRNRCRCRRAGGPGGCPRRRSCRGRSPGGGDGGGAAARRSTLSPNCRGTSTDMSTR